MSYSNYQLNQRISYLQSEINNIIAGLGNYVPINGNITINNIKTFSTLPQSSVLPVNADDFVNKTYADSLVPTPINAVLIDGTQTLGTGIKTFTNLPQSSTVPLDNKDLVNKLYVDSSIPPPLNAVLIDGTQTLGTGIKTFTNLPRSSAVPTNNNELVNKLYVDTLPIPSNVALKNAINIFSTTNTFQDTITLDNGNPLLYSTLKPDELRVINDTGGGGYSSIAGNSINIFNTVSGANSQMTELGLSNTGGQDLSISSSLSVQLTSPNPTYINLTNPNGGDGAILCQNIQAISTDLTLQSASQINLNSNDNINLNAGVNCFISCAPGSGSNLIRLNSNDNKTEIGDVDGTYNKTTLTVDDFTQDIYVTSPNGRIWNGDNNGIGTGARTRFDVSKRQMSVFCGQQASVDYVNDTIGTKIEEYCNFISTDVDVQMKAVGDYFNDLTPNGEGWYCYIMNYGGGDIQITSNDGKQFISRTIGGINPTGIIGKYTTARLTLVYLHPFGDYFWSLMSGF